MITPSALLLLLVSPAVGSFLAVLADRLPRGEDVLVTPSACRQCGRRIEARDLVPILSYARLRGRCRHCRAPIPPWHLHVEIAAVGLAALAVIGGGGAAAVWLTALVLWALLALATTDLIWMRLPDALTLALFSAAIALSAADPERDPLASALGAALGAGAFWLVRILYAAIRRREGLGLGDVKLMAGIGALVGPWNLAITVLTAACIALAGTGFVALRRNRRPGGATALPFGAALCLAAVLDWFWQTAAF